ncbi:WxL domain-containing protein [Enterococcus sp. DIV0756]|uniref:WxL domain-containing protein n=1 Tax=Enterococcus sp. DIV0756 TaxID=2774636 RepID=UPI003F26A505
MKSLKGKMLVSLASVATLGAVTLGSVGVFAANAGNENSDVTVGFRNYTEPPGTGDGILSLQHVPEVMNFGASNTAGGTLTALTGDLNGAEYAMLRDDRAVSDPTDWELSAKASNLTATDNSSIITNGDIRIGSTGAIKEWGPSSLDPTQPQLGSDYASQPTVTRTPVVLPLDGTTSDTLATTSDAGTRGYFALPLDSVEMNITSVSSQAGKQFTGTVTWTLDDLV